MVLVYVNGKIKRMKSVKMSVDFPTFLINVTITIEVIDGWEQGITTKKLKEELNKFETDPFDINSF